jgi:hypothetical protein
MPNIAQGRWNNIGQDDDDDDDDDDDEKGKVRLTHETGRQTGGGGGGRGGRGGGGFVSVRVGSAAASIHEQLEDAVNQVGNDAFNGRD